MKLNDLKCLAVIGFLLPHIVFAQQEALAHPGHSLSDQSATEGNHQHDKHENGIGRDLDGDTNPATRTRAYSRIGDAATAAFDPPYRVITFEAPPGGHDTTIHDQFKADYGVTFSEGLSQQICEGQRYFQYNSKCTYLRAPSGKYAVTYQDDFKRPLKITFDKPVCAAAMAIYPTGGKEAEPFEISLQGYSEAKIPLSKAKLKLSWTENTFRWRHMAMINFLDQPAKTLEINIRSLDGAKSRAVIRFLMDDLAFVNDGCDAFLAALEQPASQ